MNVLNFLIFYFGVVLLVVIVSMSLHYIGIRVSDKYRNWFFLEMVKKDSWFYVTIVLAFPLSIFEVLMGLFEKEEQKWKKDYDDGWIEIEAKKVVEAVKNK